MYKNNAGTTPVFRPQSALSGEGALLQSNSAKDNIAPLPGLAIMAQDLLPRLGQMTARMQKVAQCLRQTPQSDSNEPIGPPPSDLYTAIHQAHCMMSYCEGIMLDIEGSLGV